MMALGHKRASGKRRRGYQGGIESYIRIGGTNPNLKNSGIVGGTEMKGDSKKKIERNYKEDRYVVM